MMDGACSEASPPKPRRFCFKPCTARVMAGPLGSLFYVWRSRLSGAVTRRSPSGIGSAGSCSWHGNPSVGSRGLGGCFVVGWKSVGVLDYHPATSAEALAFIGALYRHEAILREQSLAGEDKFHYREQHSRPVVDAFWAWRDQQCHQSDLLPSSPLSKALKYAMGGQGSLQVVLSDPDVPIDTNHLERRLRPIPMGKKSWLLAWTEIGAERMGLIQSLLVTCHLQDVDPYTYLVDILQRISVQPASRVLELTHRVWKTMFADHPMKLDVALAGQ